MGRVEDRANTEVKKSNFPLRARMVIGFLVLASAMAWVVVATLGDASQVAPPAAGGSGQGSLTAGLAEVGSPAPDFSLTTLDGRQVSLEDFRGQPLLLNFFASWCDPCKEEAPVLKAMAADAASAGYAILGVAIQDDRESLTWLMWEEGLTFPAALDLDSKVSRGYRVVGPPTTFFIDAKGVIRDIFAGPLTLEQAQRSLKRAAGETDTGTGLVPSENKTGVRSAETSVAAGAAGLALALGAGLLSFLSPCVLPLLPAYLGYITGISVEELSQQNVAPRQRRRVLSRIIAFALGLILVFTALGASASLIGEWLAVYRPLLARVGGLIVLAFGLHMLGVLPIALLYREFRPALNARRLSTSGGMLNAVAMGAAFAIGWTPCVGPILGAILLLASQAENIGIGVMMLMSYGLGLVIPLVITGIAASRMLGAVVCLRRHLGLIEKLSGALLIGMGVLLLSGRLSVLAVWLQRVL